MAAKDETCSKQHYTEAEKMILVQLVNEHRNIVENKKTGAVNLKEKNDAWGQIALSFNSQGLSMLTEKQLRKLWENLKQKKRQQMTEFRRERLLTGGGPPVPDLSNPILNLVNEAAPHADVELPCTWDSTAIYENKDNNQEDKEEDIDYEIEYLNDESLITPHTTEPERCLSPKATIVNTPSEKVMSSMPSFSRKRRYSTRKDDEEKQLRIQKAKEILEQQRELHQLRMRTAETEAKIAEIKLKQAMMELQAVTREKCTS